MIDDQIDHDHYDDYDDQYDNDHYDGSLLLLFSLLFERSEFLIDTSPQKNPSVCPCARMFD